MFTTQTLHFNGRGISFILKCLPIKRVNRVRVLSSIPIERINNVNQQKRLLCLSYSKVDSDTKLNEKKLPRLPVPSLEDTLNKYLKSLKPLLSESEFEESARIVESFGAENGVGQKLQHLLEDRAKSCDNWLSDWWLSSAYLDCRAPLPVFSSPGLVFPPQQFSTISDQLHYSAKLVAGALKYIKLIDNHNLPVDQMNNQILDMSQYSKVFGTNRVPGKDSDSLLYTPHSRHFVVAYKNYFYKVPAYSPGENTPLQSSEILGQLNYIVDSTAGLSGIPFGLLTSEQRDRWGALHEKLRKDKANDLSVKEIEESLFLLSIERPNRTLHRPPASSAIFTIGVEDLSLTEKQTVSALEMLHGNKTNSGNRWFDKTVQFIVGSDGESGLTYEHSPAEGTPVANMMDFILNNLKREELPENTTEETNLRTNIQPVHLPFSINQELSDGIAGAKENLDKLISDLFVVGFTFKKYGKKLIKKSSLSPDSFIQLAIQAAFHRIHGKPAAHYESAATRMFSGGRTETIRSCSSESLQFSQAINGDHLSSVQKWNLLQVGVSAHKKYAAEAVRGLGVDRHLLGLQLIGKHHGIPLHPLYTDTGFIKSTRFRLSTSQVPSCHQAFMVYGPLVPDGYGCCYNPRDDDITFGISAFNSSTETNAEAFKVGLIEVLMDMHELIATNRDK